MANVLIFIIFNIVLIVAQVFLARNEKKWPGLVIPIFNTVTAVVISLLVAPFSTTMTRTIDGVISMESWTTPGRFVSALIVTFILFMIPAVINLIIYFVTKGNQRKKKVDDIAAMKINDL